jgi:hypothetical protein
MYKFLLVQYRLVEQGNRDIERPENAQWSVFSEMGPAGPWEQEWRMPRVL